MLPLVALTILLQADGAEALTPLSPPVPPPAQPVSVHSVAHAGAIADELAVKLDGEVRRALGNAGVNVQPDVETNRLLAGRTAMQCAANVPCYGLLATVSQTPVAVFIEA